MLVKKDTKKTRRMGGKREVVVEGVADKRAVVSSGSVEGDRLFGEVGGRVDGLTARAWEDMIMGVGEMGEGEMGSKGRMEGWTDCRIGHDRTGRFLGRLLRFAQRLPMSFAVHGSVGEAQLSR